MESEAASAGMGYMVDLLVDSAPSVLPDIALDAMRMWDGAAGDVTTAYLAANGIGAFATSLRGWLRALSPATLTYDSVAKQTPSALDQARAHLVSLHRRAAERLEELMPVEALRQRMATEKATLTTKDKLDLWKQICVFRFASLVVWPCFAQLAAHAVATEASMSVMQRALSQSAAASSGGLVAGVMTS